MGVRATRNDILNLFPRRKYPFWPAHEDDGRPPHHEISGFVLLVMAGWRG